MGFWSKKEEIAPAIAVSPQSAADAAAPIKFTVPPPATRPEPHAWELPVPVATMPVPLATLPDATSASAVVSEGASEAQRNRNAHAKALAASLGEIVSVMLRVAQYRAMPLAHLEASVLPALITGQYSVAETRTAAGGINPVGFLLWASVSQEIDQQLTADTEGSLRLSVQDWLSGPQIWLIEAVGEPAAIQAIIAGLRQRAWAGVPIKTWVKSVDGTMTVSMLPETSPDEAQ